MHTTLKIYITTFILISILLLVIYLTLVSAQTPVVTTPTSKKELYLYVKSLDIRTADGFNKAKHAIEVAEREQQIENLHRRLKNGLLSHAIQIIYEIENSNNIISELESKITP